MSDSASSPAFSDASNPATLLKVLQQLRNSMVSFEQAAAGQLEAVDPAHRAGARNLLHYLALRRQDLRALQTRLARFGLSSLSWQEPMNSILIRIKYLLDTKASV